SFEVSNLRFL
ncbi:unnamed protein product, partial [Allacma fusca]